MGTPELARRCLQGLLESPAVILVAVVSQPDRPKGRDLKLQPSPVKELAVAHQLPVIQPERAREENFFTALKGYQPELIVVAAYGQILPQRILDLPSFGCLNVHTSLLPKYRGAAPIQWAILNGELETGVTIMKMDAGMDTGPIVTMERTAIQDNDTAQTLHDRLAEIGAKLMAKTIPGYTAGHLAPSPQPAEGVTYAPKIAKEDGRIDWTKPANEIRNRIRGLTPWPGAFTFLPAAENLRPMMLKIWTAAVSEDKGQPGEILGAGPDGITVACGTGSLRIEELQLEGGRRLSADQFLLGHKLALGSRFG